MSKEELIVDLSFDFGKRGLWGGANQNFLLKQPFHTNPHIE
jgi:hypothetical protein